MASVAKVVVPVSGGKDSQACLQLAVEQYGAESVRGLFCDTRFEHPITYEHIETMRRLYGVRIDRVCAGDVPSQVRRYNRWPGVAGARFCTDNLKLKPSKNYYTELAAEQGGGFEVWLGMRLEESHERAKRYDGRDSGGIYPLHDLFPSNFPKRLYAAGVTARLPVLEWSFSQVLKYLAGNESPLYRHFDRVGCFPCLAAGDTHKLKAFRMDAFGARQRELVAELERDIGRSVWRSAKGHASDAHDDLFGGCAICQM